MDDEDIADADTDMDEVVEEEVEEEEVVEPAYEHLMADWGENKSPIGFGFIRDDLRRVQETKPVRQELQVLMTSIQRIVRILQDGGGPKEIVELATTYAHFIQTLLERYPHLANQSNLCFQRIVVFLSIARRHPTLAPRILARIVRMGYLAVGHQLIEDETYMYIFAFFSPTPVEDVARVIGGRVTDATRRRGLALLGMREVEVTSGASVKEMLTRACFMAVGNLLIRGSVDLSPKQRSMTDWDDVLSTWIQRMQADVDVNYWDKMYQDLLAPLTKILKAFNDTCMRRTGTRTFFDETRLRLCRIMRGKAVLFDFLIESFIWTFLARPMVSVDTKGLVYDIARRTYTFAEMFQAHVWLSQCETLDYVAYNSTSDIGTLLDSLRKQKTDQYNTSAIRTWTKLLFQNGHRESVENNTYPRFALVSPLPQDKHVVTTVATYLERFDDLHLDIEAAREYVLHCSRSVRDAYQRTNTSSRLTDHIVWHTLWQKLVNLFRSTMPGREFRGSGPWSRHDVDFLNDAEQIQLYITYIGTEKTPFIHWSVDLMRFISSAVRHLEEFARRLAHSDHRAVLLETLAALSAAPFDAALAAAPCVFEMPTAARFRQLGGPPDVV